MKKILFLIFAVLTISVFADNKDAFAISQSKDAITVTSNGVRYSLNKQMVPTWNIPLFYIGDKRNRDGLVLIMKTENGIGNLHGPMQLFANSKQGKLSILQDDEMQKCIRYELSLTPVPKRNLILPNGKLVVYMTVIKGIPGARITLRMTSQTDEFIVSALNTIFGDAMETWALDGNNPQKYANAGDKNFRAKKRYVVARKQGKNFFITPANLLHPRRAFVTVSEANAYNKPKLTKHESCELSLTLGQASTKEEEKQLLSLEQLVKIPSEKDYQHKLLMRSRKMLAVPVKTTPNWSTIPVMKSVGGIDNYRPGDSNTWQNDDDLSLDVKTAYDQNNLYIHILVRDSVFEQKAINDAIWSGDCVQIGFDLLNSKAISKNYVEIGITASNTPTVWCWQHPNKAYLGNLSEVITLKTKRTDATQEYEVTVPWKFLKPFSLGLGKMGFNLVALDADGTGIENWMGITDGIAGGKDPSFFDDLYFEMTNEMAQLQTAQSSLEFITPQSTLLDNMPLDMNVIAMLGKTEGKATLKLTYPNYTSESFPLKRGFNNIPISKKSDTFQKGINTIRGEIVVNGKTLLQQEITFKALNTPFLKKLNDQAIRRKELLKQKIDAITQQYKVEPSYLISTLARADYFTHMIDVEISRDSIYRSDKIGGAKRRMIATTPGYKVFIFDRAYKNVMEITQQLDQQLVQADLMLMGLKKVRTVPTPVLDSHPVVKNGGFNINDRELFLLGPNTWCIHYTELETIAKSGMNFFDIFQRIGNTIVHQDEKFHLPETYFYTFNSHLVTEAERLKIFFFGRFWHGNGHVNADEHYTTMQEDATKRFGINAYMKQSPSMAYVVTQSEGFAKESDIPKLERDFTTFLSKKFSTVQRLNQMLGTAFPSFGHIHNTDLSLYPQLKYQFFLFESERNIAALKRFNQYKRKLWGLPLSSHFSELFFTPWDTLLGSADFQRIWKEFEVIGWDGGIKPIHRRWAMDWSTGENILCDMARSLYPEKPIANNELHTIPGKVAMVEDRFAYASTILPYFHGKNASVAWLWDIDYHSPWGSYYFTRAQGFKEIATAALHLREFAPEIAAFRKQKPVFAILYSLPSLMDSDYLNTMITIYESCYFSGLPVRFVTEASIADRDLENYQLLVIPGATHVSDKTFAAIMDFAKRKKVISFNPKSMTRNEFGQVVSSRKPALDTIMTFPVKSLDQNGKAFNQVLKQLNIAPEIEITDTNNQRVFGVEYRISRDQQGRRLIYVMNLEKVPREIFIDTAKTRWFNLLTDQAIPNRLTVKPMELLLLREL